MACLKLLPHVLRAVFIGSPFQIKVQRDGIEEIRQDDKDINYVQRYQMFLNNDDAAATQLAPPYDVIAKRDGLKVLEIPEYAQIHNVTINSVAETIKSKPGETMAFLKAYCEAICLFKTQKERTCRELSVYRSHFPVDR